MTIWCLGSHDWLRLVVIRFLRSLMSVMPLKIRASLVSYCSATANVPEFDKKAATTALSTPSPQVAAFKAAHNTSPPAPPANRMLLPQPPTYRAHSVSRPLPLAPPANRAHLPRHPAFTIAHGACPLVPQAHRTQPPASSIHHMLSMDSF